MNFKQFNSQQNKLAKTDELLDKVEFVSNKFTSTTGGLNSTDTPRDADELPSNDGLKSGTDKTLPVDLNSTVEHYKKYGAEGDKLLLETAKNNYQKGYDNGKKEELERIIDIIAENTPNELKEQYKKFVRLEFREKQQLNSQNET